MSETRPTRPAGTFALPTWGTYGPSRLTMTGYRHAPFHFLSYEDDGPR